MKITIPADSDDSSVEKTEITLSDEGYDVLGFIDVFVGTNPPVTVHVKDLLPAVIAFMGRYETYDEGRWVQDRELSEGN